MSATRVEIVIWVLSFLFPLALLYVLVRQKRWKDFPVFTSMMTFQVAINVVLFFLHRTSKSTYYYAYWISASADYAFQLALIFEIARSVLRPAKMWVRDARASFLGWSAMGLLLALAVVYFIGPSSSKGLAIWNVRGTLFNSVLTLEVFLSMSAAANRLGLPWRSHVMSLGQGIAAIAAIDVVTDIAHIHYGWGSDTSTAYFYYVGQAVYLGVLLFWSYAFWQPERVREPLSKEMQEYLLALHRRVQYDLDRQNVENSV